jgi:hypothetical protein
VCVCVCVCVCMCVCMCVRMEVCDGIISAAAADELINLLAPLGRD